MAPELAIVHVESRAELRKWLVANHATSPGVWLSTWRSDDHGPRVAYDDIAEECLCFGWIDSTARTFDDQRGGMRLTPRRPGSGWSRPNKIRIERLLAEGLMAPAGLAVVDSAKADGSWELLDEIEELVVPADLRAALREAGASEQYDALTRGRRKQILWWIKSAKREKTRATRIATVVRAAGAGRSPLD